MFDRRLYPMTRLALLCMIAVVCAAGPASSAPAEQAQDVAAVVIHKTVFQCGDEAVLVTEPAEVRELAGLLLDNPTAHHGCGYHWAIRLVRPDGSMTVVLHNQECERYARDDARVHEVLARYFKRVLGSPSHFIVDLTVPSTTAPSDVSSALASDGRVFFFDGLEARLPRLTVRATAARPAPAKRARVDVVAVAAEKNAEQILAAAVAALARKRAAQSLGPVVDHGYYDQDGRIFNEVERTLFFPVGTPLRELPVLPAGASVHGVEVPESYSAQLVTSVRLDASARAALLARHPFLRAAARFAEGCVPLR
jgi:hypothetical protein